jgi:hypothetical protein
MLYFHISVCFTTVVAGFTTVVIGFNPGLLACLAGSIWLMSVDWSGLMICYELVWEICTDCFY